MSDWTQQTPLQVGFHPPEQCVRGRTDCRSLHQIISSGEKPTFICCGEVKPGCTPVPQDKWSFCMGMCNGPHDHGYDLRIFIDRRDMSHMAAVLSAGLAIIMQPDEEPRP